MATITQIVAAQTYKPPCNACGRRPRAGSVETTPSPVSRRSSYNAVSVPATVSELHRTTTYTPPLAQAAQRPDAAAPEAPKEAAPKRWQRALTAVRASLALGRKGS